MRKSRIRKEDHAIDFWQSATDLSFVLSLILLLLVVLLLLYIFQLPENQEKEIWGTEREEQRIAENRGELRGDSELGELYEGRDRDYDDYSWRQHGGDGSGYREEEFHERYPIPSAGGTDWNKAAVYVTVIDAETQRALREPGITFELYQEFEGGAPTGAENLADGQQQNAANNGAIRYLNTYYPQKIEYRNFMTTELGNFYLPEKIEEGGYYFKELNAPEGYDSADTIRFVVDDEHDWSDPYVVSVALSPSKNVIRVRLLDADTGKVLSDGQFKVTAAEDIVTFDNTLRFAQGQEAANILIGSDGVGVSEELYLGSYLVAQTDAPAYYTTADDVVLAAIGKKDGMTPTVYEFRCEKTEISLRLTDDLTHEPIAGAAFNLYVDGVQVRSGTTDAQGELMFTNLEKNVTYTLRQSAAVGEYQMDEAAYTYYVDQTGRIMNKAKAAAQLTNYIPRVEIALSDLLTHTPVEEKALSLYRANGEIVRTWTSGTTAMEITGLEEGDYYILIGGKENSRHDFSVTDTKKINRFTFEIWSMSGILLIMAAALLIPLTIVVIVLIARKLGGKKKKE